LILLGKQWKLFADLRGEGDAVNLRHADVEDDGVARIDIEPAHDFRAVREGRARVALAAQVGREEAIEEAIVVNNEEVHAGLGLWVADEIAPSVPSDAGLREKWCHRCRAG